MFVFAVRGKEKTNTGSRLLVLKRDSAAPMLRVPTVIARKEASLESHDTDNDDKDAATRRACEMRSLRRWESTRC